MRRMSLLVAVATVVSLAASRGVAGEEKEVQMDQVPAAARQAAEKAAGSVKLVKASIEEEPTGAVYELQGKNEEGRNIEIDVTADGTLLEVETEVEMSDVAEAAAATLKKRMNGFQAKFIEKSERPASDSTGKASVWYEFEGQDGEGQPIDIEVSECGTHLVLEEKDDTDVRVN